MSRTTSKTRGAAKPRKASKATKIWIGVLVLLLVAGGALAGGKFVLRRRAMQWKAQGLAAADAGDYAKSADLLSRYLSRYGGDSRTLRRYVQVRELAELPNGRHLTETVNALKLLISEDPELQDRRHLLDLYVRLERGPEALDTANSILSQVKNDSRTLQIKVDVLTRMHREREALGIAQDWAHSSPNDIDAQMAYFALRSAVEQSPDIILSDATKLLDQHKDDPRFEMLLGSVYARQADVPHAREWLNKAAAHPQIAEATVKTIVTQFDDLGLAQDSLAVLRAHAAKGASAELRHLLGQRDWEAGAWAEAADMLADVNPGDLKSDATLAAQRAIALTNVGNKAEAQPIRAALAGRSQAVAKAWTMLLRRILDSEVIDDKQVVAACHEALLLDPKNPYLAYYLGDSIARLGEADLAIEAFQRSVAFDPTWPMPSVRLVDLLLQKGRGQQALAIAQQAQRTGNPAAVIMLAKAATVYFQQGGKGDKEQLFKLIDVVQSKIPGEDQTLLAKIDLLGQQGTKDGKDQAIKIARSLLARKPAPDEQLLLNVASLSRRYDLGLENDALAVDAQAHGMTPTLAYVRAVDQFLAGHAEAALKAFDESARRAGKSDDQIWKLARARFLDVTGNKSAHDAYVALGDAFPNAIAVQQAAATARAVSNDWDFMQKTIDRLKALTGDSGLDWKLAQARLMVRAPRSDKDVEDGSVLLSTKIIPANPMLPEPHVLLAEALSRLQRTDAAIDQLSLAVKLDPGNVPVALQLASLLQSHGDFDRVQQELGNISDRLQSSDQRHQAALLLARQGNLDKAIALLEDGQKSGDPPDLLLAALYARRQQFDKADAIIQKLMAKPDLDTIRFAASLYVSQGRRGDAEAALARLDSLDLAPGVQDATYAAYALQTRDLNEAIRRFQLATQKAPTNPSFWQSLAACQVTAGKATEALATLDEATRVLPADPGFAVMKKQAALFSAAASDPTLRPVALMILRDPKQADTSFDLLHILIEGRRALDNEHLAGQLQQFAERHPESLQAQLQLIQVYVDMGRKGDALTAAQRAMTAFPTDPLPARVAVQVAAAGQRWQDMISAADALKKRSPNESAAADLATIRAQLGMRQFSAVLTQLQPYVTDIKADPQKTPDLTEAYCIALLNTGGADDAMTLLWPLAQKSPDWRVRMAQTALESTDHDTAAQWLDRVATIVPADAVGEQVMLAESYDRLATTTGSSQLGERATRIYAQVIGDPKAGAVALAAAGFRAESHGDLKSAEALYRRAIKADASLFVAKNNLAMLLARNGGDLTEAERLASEAVTTQPRVAGVRDTLAFVQAKVHNFKAAADSERAAIEIDPDNVAWRVRQARYLLDGGDPVRAAESLKALDSARLDVRKAPPDVQKELDSLRTRIRGERAQAMP